MTCHSSAVASADREEADADFYRWYGKRWREPDEISKLIIGFRLSICGARCLVTAGCRPKNRPLLAGRVPLPEQHRVRPHAAGRPRPFRKYAPKAINATSIGLYYLAFFAANSMVGRVGGFLEKWPITNFWLLHAAFALGSGLCFVIFKFVAQRQLQVEQ